MTDLWAALALVAVLEGLVLFAFPGAWRRTAEQLLSTPVRRLRVIGALVMGAGLVALYLVRH
ncbi:DUF2065 domain-containing protein [Lysobacter brunescens]|uniref:DUF2065 domain-containing protein n=1 Tax=Lysobacter brunescens TaxID=262323 RepID=A0ABW2YEJ4_9GAMM